MFGGVVRRLGGRQLRLERRGRFLSLLVGTSPVKIVVLGLSGRILSIGPTTHGVLKVSSLPSVINGHLSRLSSPLTTRLRPVPLCSSRAIHLGSTGVCGYARSSFISHNFRRSFCLIRVLARRIFGTRGGTCRGIVHVVTRRIGGAATNVASALSALRTAFDKVRSARSVYRILDISVRHYCDVDRFVAGFTSIIHVPRPRAGARPLGTIIFSYGHFVRAVYLGQGVQVIVRLSSISPVIGLSGSLFRRMLIGVVGGTSRTVNRSNRVCVHAFHGPIYLRVTSANGNVSGRARTGLFDPFFSAGHNNRNVNLVFVHRILRGRGYSFSLEACTSKLAEFEVLFR